MIHDDTILKQLTLTHKLISFRTLIKYIKKTKTQKKTFKNILITRNHLNYHQLKKLKNTLQQNPKQNIQKIKTKQTLILKHIQNTTNNNLSKNTNTQHTLLSIQHTLIHLNKTNLIPIHQTSKTIKITPPPLKHTQQKHYKLHKILNKKNINKI